MSYQIGGGRAGNLAAGRPWEESDGDWSAINVVAASGGMDPETLAEAAKRADLEWHTPTRSLTVADCETLALQTPGVAIGRAQAVVGLHPDFPCTPVDGAVTIFLVRPGSNLALFGYQSAPWLCSLVQ